MTFIRTAGCNVGKPYPKDRYKDNGSQPDKCSPGSGCDVELEGGHRPSCIVAKYIIAKKQTLPIYTEKCTLYDGREFPCDTDYRVHKRMTTEDILKEIPWAVKHVCITGGEPMLHDLRPLVDQLRHEDKFVHLETSGTKNYMFPAQAKSGYIWITVSPKHGCLKSMLDYADELKFLVDENFDPDKPMETYPEHTPYSITDLAHFTPTFLQPVNGEWEVNPKNLQLCMEWQRKYPQFRLSLQGHKVLSHYLKETVR